VLRLLILSGCRKGTEKRFDVRRNTGEVHRDDPDDPMRTAIRQVMGVFAELDRKLVAKRLRDGRLAKAAAGRKAVGDYPFGYAATGKGRDRDAGPIEAEQKAVARIVVFEPGRDSKEGRATAVSPYIRAGNVHLPTTRVASMAPETSFDVEAFILEATAFPSGAHDDRIDAASQYLIETYLVGGKATLLLPTGVIPLSAARRQRQQALPVQQRLTAGGQPSHWGQALSPFQQRLTDRQRGR
jgi:hypothetical protein